MPKTLTTIIRQVDLDGVRTVDIDWGNNLYHEAGGHLRLRQAPASGNYYPADYNGNLAHCQSVICHFSCPDMRAMVGFQAKIFHQKVNGAQVTKASFRLGAADGLTNYWWDGAAWSEPTLDTQWNTEDEVSNNIGAFSVGLAAREFTITCQLGTDDKHYTPRFEWMKVGMQVDTASFLEDALRTLAKAVKSGMSYLADFDFVATATGDTLDLPTVAAAAKIPGFKPLEADAVFDLTADPTMQTDLYASMNSSTVAQLSSSVPSGHKLRVRMRMDVTVVIESTDQDYTQVQQVPMIQLRNVRTAEGAEQPVGDHVTHKYDGVADMMKPPLRETLEMDIALLAPNGVDLRRMIQSAINFFLDTPRLTSGATGEMYRLWLRGKFRRIGGPELSGLAQAQATLQISDVMMFRSGSEQQPLVLYYQVHSVVGVPGTSQVLTGDAATNDITTGDDTTTATPPAGDTPN